MGIGRRWEFASPRRAAGGMELPELMLLRPRPLRRGDRSSSWRRRVAARARWGCDAPTRPNDDPLLPRCHLARAARAQGGGFLGGRRPGVAPRGGPRSPGVRGSTRRRPQERETGARGPVFGAPRGAGAVWRGGARRVAVSQDHASTRRPRRAARPRDHGATRQVWRRDRVPPRALGLRARDEWRGRSSE
eukprot:scaffold886_cov317-Prasinococcus_capsulatus_cf.AAC.6